MPGDRVLYAVESGVATIILNRPDQANAIDVALCAELTDALCAAEADAAVRVLVLAGAGAHFSAGGDLKLIQSFLHADPGAVEESLTRSLAVIAHLYRFRKPTVARVHGSAVGGGCALALACDFVVAAEPASFGFTFVHLGLVPDLGALYLLPKLLGPRRAKELCYLGRSLSAAEALAYGLVSRVVAPPDLDAAVHELAGALRSKPPAPLAQMKTILQRGLDADLDTVLELEARAQTLLWQTADTRQLVERMVARIKGPEPTEGV